MERAVVSTMARACEGCGEPVGLCRVRVRELVYCAACGAELLRQREMELAEERAGRRDTDPAPPPTESGPQPVPAPAQSGEVSAPAPPRTLGQYSSALRRYLAGEPI